LRIGTNPTCLIYLKLPRELKPEKKTKETEGTKDGQKIALLSGKGGCGKTTIGLYIASMLACYNLKVLLIDCDLNTNGATFYCRQNTAGLGAPCSFRSLILRQDLSTTEKIHIGERIDLIPSNTGMENAGNTAYTFRKNDTAQFETKLNQLEPEKYDAIIFDCPAGYSDIFRLILPQSDTLLYVLEPDAANREAYQNLIQKTGGLRIAGY